MGKHELGNSNQFERNVLMLISILGLTRSIIALVGDFREPDLADDFFSDLAFALLFAFMIGTILFGKISQLKVSLFFCGLIVLLLLAFYNIRGVEGNIEHNIYAGLILISFTLKDKLPLYFIVSLILGVIFSFILLEINQDISNTFQDRHTSDLNFIFAALGVIGITYYAKNVFTQKRIELKNTGVDLKSKMVELQAKTEELSQKKENLESLTLDLDSKVNTRTKALKNQQKRREKYLSITLNELSETYEKTILMIDKLDGAGDNRELIQLMIASGDKLKLEMESLKEKLNGISG